jgi:molybdopterin synthase sulfur carrier subunit
MGARADRPCRGGGRAAGKRGLGRRGDGYAEALRYPQAIRVAIDQEHAHHSEKIAGAREIALFPPMTGG